MNIEEMKAALVQANQADNLDIDVHFYGTRDALKAAVVALDAIHEILDGDPTEPGKSWSSDEIGCVAEVIVALGYTIREPGQGGEIDEDEAA